KRQGTSPPGLSQDSERFNASGNRAWHLLDCVAGEGLGGVDGCESAGGFFDDFAAGVGWVVGVEDDPFFGDGSPVDAAFFVDQKLWKAIVAHGDGEVNPG